MINILKFILLIQATLVISSTLKSKRGKINVRFQNIYRKDNVLWMNKTSSASLCIASCVYHINSRSVAFNRNDNICQIFSRDSTNQVVAGTLENGWIHYDVSPAECLYGWREYGGHCYYFSSNQKYWNDAQTHCLTMGANLVKIDDATKNAWIIAILQSLHGQNTWIGANKIGQVPGTWVWVSDNSVLSYNYWAIGEPSYGSMEECIHIWIDGWASAANTYHWNDKQCQNAFYFICEK